MRGAWGTQAQWRAQFADYRLPRFGAVCPLNGHMRSFTCSMQYLMTHGGEEFVLIQLQGECLGIAGVTRPSDPPGSSRSVVEWLAFRLSLCKRFSAIDLRCSCARSSSDGRARPGAACLASGG